MNQLHNLNIRHDQPPTYGHSCSETLISLLRPFLFLVATFVFVSSPLFSAFAESHETSTDHRLLLDDDLAANPKWLADTARLKSILANSEHFPCAEAWDILWPWAKQGSLAARGLLFSFMSIHRLTPPGGAGDFASYKRDSLILAVHSTGVTEHASDYYDRVIDLYATFDHLPSGKAFTKCVETTKSPSCITLAVESRLVPTFEEFSYQIELFANGKKSYCASATQKQDSNK